jgi:glycosyl transferase family 25
MAQSVQQDSQQHPQQHSQQDPQQDPGQDPLQDPLQDPKRSAAENVPRVNDLVDAVLVITVRSFADRIAHMKAELARFNIQAEWILDYDPPQISPEMIERVFAPSDLRLPHQSAVLKHIAAWRYCAEHDCRRVLIFEDDVVFAPDFDRVFAQAMAEADRLVTPYLVYLGCGHNRYAEGARRSPTMLVPGGPLPAAEAIVIDRASAIQRMAWLDRNKVTRPPDWLLREMDAELGIPHYWLREPVVEQGSMNGKFHSLLDEKRRGRGLIYAWLRFRWDRFRHRVLGGRTVNSDSST